VIVTDVYQSVKQLHPAKTAVWIKVLFGVETLGGLRNIVLDGGPDPPVGRGMRENIANSAHSQ